MERRAFLKATAGTVFTAGAKVLTATGETSADVPHGHSIDVSGRLLVPDDGLLLGNGDLSVSVYQTVDSIIWRFGKGDVWDRRLDLSEDPKPAHIDEIAHGIREEGWKCQPYAGQTPPVALRGTANQQRLVELCQGTPPSEDGRPYPCPKPVGELALRLPVDLEGFRIRQRLDIEKAVLSISCSWASGVVLEIESFIPPEPNVVVIRWKTENWNEEGPPLWWALYRWPDPPVSEFCAKRYAEYRTRLTGSGRMCDANPKVTPLPPPAVRHDADLAYIEQAFPPDALFPNGFRCLLAPFASASPENSVEAVPAPANGEARLHIRPMPEAREGWLAVAVSTSGDGGEPLRRLQRVRELLSGGATATIGDWADRNHRNAGEFWNRSRLSIADPLLENLWYETLHACRAIYRKGSVPPGLFFPSTVKDYSLWHGDYHLNYNFQQPFWGSYAANQIELGDTYFDGVKFFLPTGRKIARDYYKCRGVFLQLSGYPVRSEEDWLGVAPMGRMAYMTGWAMNQYWWRYLYTLDRDWLRGEGYPVIRDCALFYTDFMKKGADGLYHAFPSNQGEDGFTGDPKDYTDRSQVMGHLRYCLRCAISASEVLELDEDLRRLWRERLEHCAGDEGKPPATLSGIEKERDEANPYEFSLEPGVTKPGRNDPAWPTREEALYSWYFGHYPWRILQRLRGGVFRPDTDFPRFREMVERWRHPNGLVWAMAISRYGWAGAWTESLGVIAPLQEMMLQSWEGALRLFPSWPKELDARFERFRTEGAFLVNAAWSGGEVRALEIFSEKGAPCRLYSPWPSGMKVLADSGREVAVVTDTYGRGTFPTQPGHTYRVIR